MRVNNLCGSGQYSGFYMNDASVQEVTYTTGAESAEMQSSGLRINSTPKDGGNTFAGTFFLGGAAGALQSDNRSDEVKPFVPTQPGIDYTYEINPSVGGPIVRDKIWFYVTYKYADEKNFVLGAQFADGTPAYRQLMGNYSGIGRITWAATQKDKIRFYLEKQYNGEFYNGFNTLPNSSPEAVTDAFGDGWLPQVKWTQATSNRLMLEAGISSYNLAYEQNARPEVGPLDLPNLEATTLRLTKAAGYFLPTYTSETVDYSSMAAMSYITGSHAIKAGMTMLWGTNTRDNASTAQINSLIFFNTSPIQVSVTNSPSHAEQKVNSDLGLYVQDAWTVKRLTLNLGARYDHFNAEVPAGSAPAGPWIGARSFDRIPNLPNWDDWSTRVAVSYDLFGTGKTALKGNVSKYIASQAAGYAQNFNALSYATETRTWIDRDANRSILNADGSIQFSEVLAGTPTFGLVNNRPDPNLARGYNWEYSASVQHELAARLSVSAGYHRREFFNLDVTDNLNLSATEWNSFGIVTPTDPRLPTSGDPITMYSLNTNKIGTPTDHLRTYSATNTTVYDGVEFSANLRRSKLLLFGGVTTDRRVTTSCDGSTSTAGLSARDNPNGLRFCDSAPPFRTTVKASAAYQLPWDSQVSGSFLSVPGPSINANYTVNHRHSRTPDCRNNGWRDNDCREPGGPELRLPGLPEPARHALREVVPNQSYAHSGLRGRLQRAERGHRHDRQPDLRQQPGHQLLAQSAHDHAGTVCQVRHVNDVLRARREIGGRPGALFAGLYTGETSSTVPIGA